MSQRPEDPKPDDQPQDVDSPSVLDGSAIDPSEEPVLPPSGRGPRRGQGLDERGRLKSGRLKGLSMGAAIWLLSWPILTESILNSLVGLTDTALAAQMPGGVAEAATDAIGAAAYFQWFIGLIAMALATGATALVSRSVGKGRLAVANASIGQTLLLAFCAGGAVGGGMFYAAPWIGGLVNLRGEAFEMFVEFVRIISVSVPAGSALFAGIACLRGAGESVQPLVGMIAVNIVNMIVSFVLSGVPLGITSLEDGEIVRTTLVPAVLENGLGISGIAIGTVAAHVVGALIITGFLLRGTHGVILKRRWLRPHWVTMGRLVRLGLPNFFESLGMWLGNFVIVMMVGWLTLSRAAMESGGGGLFGAHIMAIRIEAFSFLPGFAMGTAAATLAGQYLGAGSVAHARKAILRCVAIGAGLMTVLGILFILIPARIVGLLSSEPSHLELTPPLLITCGFVQVFFGLALVIRSALRGAGDVHVTMWITWICTYGVRIPLAFLLSGVDIVRETDAGLVTLLKNPMPDDFPISGLTGLWVGLCAELVVRGLVFSFRFFQGGWSKARV